MEELLAELGAAFLCANLDVTLEPRKDHTSYVANWLEGFKSGNRAVFAAASHAQRAADFLTGLQPACGVIRGRDIRGSHRPLLPERHRLGGSNPASSTHRDLEVIRRTVWSRE